MEFDLIVASSINGDIIVLDCPEIIKERINVQLFDNIIINAHIIPSERGIYELNCIFDSKSLENKDKNLVMTLLSFSKLQSF